LYPLSTYFRSFHNTWDKQNWNWQTARNKSVHGHHQRKAGREAENVAAEWEAVWSMLGKATGTVQF
jgi:hypothetical protein